MKIITMKKKYNVHIHTIPWMSLQTTF